MKDKYPLVSVIITTHNRIDLLKRAINSVLEQSYTNIELIVVDDNSNDGTELFCNSINSLIYRKIESWESKGGNYARNQGIIIAKGEYIAFLDDDDYWVSDKLEKQVKLIEDSKCELVYCGRTHEIVKDGKIEYETILPSKNLMGDLSKKILYNIVALTSSILIRKQTLIDVGMFDENLKVWQEYELTIRLAQKGVFYFVNEPLLVYRINKNDSRRLTNKFTAWVESSKYVYDKHKQLYKRLNLIEKYLVYSLWWGEGESRTAISGDRINNFKYKILLLPFNIAVSMRKFFKRFAS